MSLRGKIIWLFCGFSIIPLLVLGAFTYWQVSLFLPDALGMTHSAELQASIRRLYVSYWAFAIGLAVATVLAFSVLVNELTRNLRELIRVSEKIGEGDLSPWLPPPTDGEVGRLNLAISRMLDRLRSMVDQVDRSGRLAAVGEVASYLAHEIRTPLSSTRMNLQRLDRWAQSGKIPPICREPIEISLKEVDRLTTAVSGVLALTRPNDAPMVPMSVHATVEQAAEVLGREMRRRSIDLRLELDAVADRVLARPGQIKGVILNLLLNAVEAQPRGGWVEVRSSLVRSLDEQRPMLELRVRDDGPGIPQEIRGRVFDPFFTTKPQGSGIGLALALQAIRQNSGDVRLEEPSVAGTGAEFVVLLPLASVGQGEPAREAPPAALAWPWNARPRVGNARREAADLALHALPPQNLGEIH